MNRAEFDGFAEEYEAIHRSNIGASGEGPEYFAEYKMRDFAAVARAAGIETAGRWVLDLGAGTGSSVAFFNRHVAGARLCCVDVSLRSLEVGTKRFPQETGFVAFDGRRLPFADGSLAGAYACCVFHHIEREAHVPLAAEVRRVLRPGGVFMVYEHNPWNPLTVQAVNTCPFDRNAVLVKAADMERRLRAAGFAQVRTRYRVFFPRALRWLRPLESRLGRVPLGAQYYTLGLA
jgi:ubiquinone/menaquinone biosynthesis C-methylase UbiE